MAKSTGKKKRSSSVAVVLFIIGVVALVLAVVAVSVCFVYYEARLAKVERQQLNTNKIMHSLTAKVSFVGT